MPYMSDARGSIRMTIDRKTLTASDKLPTFQYSRSLIQHIRIHFSPPPHKLYFHYQIFHKNQYGFQKIRAPSLPQLA